LIDLTHQQKQLIIAKEREITLLMTINVLFDYCYIMHFERSNAKEGMKKNHSTPSVITVYRCKNQEEQKFSTDDNKLHTYSNS
jgi:hypothetical protein